ncbi:MAG: radical SAM protein [Clostridia bacterium]|nr:radical SAM protein [Clostridia bacterium]
MEKVGYFMQPQHLSVNDGQGIRTLIFLAGCPLRCKWCANPEGFTATEKKDLVYKMSVEEILSEIDKQRIFYRQSGGGVTFSGGEATVQDDMLRTLSKILYDEGLHLSIETSGYFDFEQVRDILEMMDTIFMDIKLMDSEWHRLFTGQGNELILENVKKVAALGKELIIRVPVIEGVNASEWEMLEIIRYVKEHVPSPKMEFLPYHTFGNYKYEKLDLSIDDYDFKTPSQEYMLLFKNKAISEGVSLVSYR